MADIVHLQICTCAEVAGEDPDCPVHELTIEAMAAWEDWECELAAVCGYTLRRVAQKALCDTDRSGEAIETPLGGSTEGESRVAEGQSPK